MLNVSYPVNINLNTGINRFMFPVNINLNTGINRYMLFPYAFLTKHGHIMRGITVSVLLLKRLYLVNVFYEIDACCVFNRR